MEPKERGPPAKIYTANLKPLMETIGSIAPDYLGWAGSETKLKTVSRLIFEYFPRYTSIEKKHLHYVLKNRSWDTIALSFFSFLMLIGLDFVIKEWDMPELIKAQIMYMAPTMFLSTDTIKDDKPLSTEVNDLKKEIIENLSSPEKAFFEELLIDLRKFGVLKSHERSVR
jgi:hypothetical protein